MIFNVFITFLFDIVFMVTFTGALGMGINIPSLKDVL